MVLYEFSRNRAFMFNLSCYYIRNSIQFYNRKCSSNRSGSRLGCDKGFSPEPVANFGRDFSIKYAEIREKNVAKFYIKCILYENDITAKF